MSGIVELDCTEAVVRTAADKEARDGERAVLMSMQIPRTQCLLRKAS